MTGLKPDFTFTAYHNTLLRGSSNSWKSMAVVMTEELTLVVMLSTGQNSTDSVRSYDWLPLISMFWQNCDLK